jgi:proteasome lid subunit RPN8/RPN11
MFGPDVDEAARAHALREYPRESCGVVRSWKYHPLANVSPEPEESFVLPASALVDFYPVEAVVHSHCAPRHNGNPSAEDMESQIETRVPIYGIVLSDGKDAGGPVWIGDFLLDEPLVGRSFAHGVRDCYSLVRSYYWQERRIKLPEFPRSTGWWRSGVDMYREKFPEAGFARIDAADVAPGDVLLLQIRESVPHHAVVLLADGLILHHLPNRLSRREPIGPWRKYVVDYLRHGSAS